VQSVILSRCKKAGSCRVLNVTCLAVGLTACIHLFVNNLTQLWNCQISGARIRGLAAVAQLDRVLGYEPRGRGFESCQPHHMNQGLAVRLPFFKIPLPKAAVKDDAELGQLP
jgi:hypothetical protein